MALGCHMNTRSCRLSKRSLAKRPSNSKALSTKARSDQRGNAEGTFGFKPFPELWNGRWAMMGFATGCMVEIVSGKPVLQQIGIGSPNYEAGIAMVAATVGGSLIGLTQAITKARNGQMSKAEMERYKRFFGLSEEEEEERQKQRADATPADDVLSMEEPASDIQDARRSMPADRFLGPDDPGEVEEARGSVQADNFLDTTNDIQEARSAEQEMKEGGMFKSTSLDTPQQPGDADEILPPGTQPYEVEFARRTELANGRWAMIGFFLLVTIEAFTGEGLIGQLVLYGRFTGLLRAPLDVSPNDFD